MASIPLRDGELERGRITLVLQFRKLRLGVGHRVAPLMVLLSIWCLCALGRYSPTLKNVAW